MIGWNSLVCQSTLVVVLSGHKNDRDVTGVWDIRQVGWIRNLWLAIKAQLTGGLCCGQCVHGWLLSLESLEDEWVLWSFLWQSRQEQSSLTNDISFWKHLQKFWEVQWALEGSLPLLHSCQMDGSLCWGSSSARKATVSEDVGCTTSRTDTFISWFKKSAPGCTENPRQSTIQTGNSMVFKPCLWFRWVFVTPTYLPTLLQNLFWKWRHTFRSEMR